MRPREQMTSEQFLASAHQNLSELQRNDVWETYVATRPGRFRAVELLLATIRDLEEDAAQRRRAIPRSVAANVWTLSRRHQATLADFSGRNGYAVRGGLSDA